MKIKRRILRVPSGKESEIKDSEVWQYNKIVILSGEKPKDDFELHYDGKHNGLHSHHYRNNEDTCKGIVSIYPNEKRFPNINLLFMQQWIDAGCPEWIWVEYDAENIEGFFTEPRGDLSLKLTKEKEIICSLTED